ncbi:MAG: alpha/beta hydrolase [Candidatus Methanoplasma sp.]|jgi:pimeloyl-ACP methyl ester carboxylesterase|nr:alpha/beta hydrolase [Candidatus Methanoplasma sp.]
MPHVNVNGIDLYYKTEGSGPAVILVTGFGGDVGFWKRASEMLSQKYKVIMIDNRGAGKTSYSGEFTLDDISRDIICLMNELKIEKANILGWSMGSHIAYKAVLTAPERFDALVLVSSFVYRPARSNYILSSALSMAERGMPLEQLAKTMNCLSYTEEFFERMELEKKKIRLPELKDPAGLRRQLNAVEISRLDGPGCRIRTPALLIHGDMDIMVGSSEGLELAEIIPGCETLIIKDAGHIIPADAYMPAVMEFIERHQG